ncbi:MAG: MerC domain-containing protein [Betaproteobacteria bacterium]|nr:MerC domain-containing protein [Betaproteobacteria bacterium]
MKELVKEISGLMGSSVTAACCLGIPAVVGAVAAAGLGFLINDFILFPLFFGLVGFTLWALYRSTRTHASMTPFWVGLAGAGLAAVGLFVHPWLVWTGLGTLLAGSVWDAWNGRGRLACATDPGAPGAAQK